MKRKSTARLSEVVIGFLISLGFFILSTLVAIALTGGDTYQQVHLSFSDNCPSTEIKVNADKGSLYWKLENTGSTSLTCKVRYKSSITGSYEQVYWQTLNANTQTGWNFSQKSNSSVTRYYKISEVSGNLTATVKPAEFYINVT